MTDAAQIAKGLSIRARYLLMAWDEDPDAFADAWDEVERRGLIGDTSGYPKLNKQGLAVRAHLLKEQGHG